MPENVSSQLISKEELLAQVKGLKKDADIDTRPATKFVSSVDSTPNKDAIELTPLSYKSAPQTATEVAERIDAELKRERENTINTPEESLVFNSVDDQRKEQQEKILSDINERDIAKLPEEEREKIGIGILNYGYYVQEGKSKFFASVFGKSKNRYLKAISETYKKDEQKAKNEIQKIKELKANDKPSSWRQKLSSQRRVLSSQGYVWGNLIKYGRLVTDLTTLSIASPLRYVMMGSMAFSRGAEAAKEIGQQNVAETTRIESGEVAYNEAWNFYNKVSEKIGDRKISGEDLKEEYTKELPEELLSRFKNSEINSLGILGKHIKKRVVELDEKLAGAKTDEDIKEMMDKKLYPFGPTYSQLLNRYDRMVTGYGSVDKLAWGARLAEKTGKIVTGIVTVETLYNLIPKLPNTSELLSGLFSNIWKAEHLPEGADGIESKILFTAPPQDTGIELQEMNEINTQGIKLNVSEVEKPHLDLNTPDSERTFLDLDKTKSVLEKVAVAPEVTSANFIETAKQGDSIWTMAKSQLKSQFGEKFDSLDEARKTYVIDAIKDKISENPEKFGLTNPDQIITGQEIDFTEAFKNNEEINNIFGKAESLTKVETADILKNNELLKTWVSENPGEQLTSVKVDEILSDQVKIDEIRSELATPSPESSIDTAIASGEINNLKDSFTEQGFSKESLQKIVDYPSDRRLGLLTENGRPVAVITGENEKEAAKQLLKTFKEANAEKVVSEKRGFFDWLFSRKELVKPEAGAAEAVSAKSAAEKTLDSITVTANNPKITIQDDVVKEYIKRNNL